MKAVTMSRNEKMHHPEIWNAISRVCPISEMGDDICDFHIVGNDDKYLIVERKTAEDFVNSIKDGRLLNQIVKGKTITPYVYVVIVGTILPAKHGKTYINGNLTGWDYAAIEGVMLSIQELGASIVFCADENDFLPCMVRLANRSRGDVIVMPVREAAVFGGAENVLTSLPGIGAKKAADLLQHFPNVGSALWFLTDIDDKQTKIPGIAENTKKNIVRLLGGKLTYEPVGEIN